MAKVLATVLLVFYSTMLSTVKCECTLPNSPFLHIAKRGSIHSPGYPTHYVKNEDCSWLLHPPMHKSYELLVVDVEMDLRFDRAHNNNDNCDNATNYVNIEHVRGCGKEPPTCLAFILTSSSSLDCHNAVSRHFGYCHKQLALSWPFNVTFRTSSSDDNSGFRLKYQFVDCSSPLEDIKPEANGGQDSSTDLDTTVRTETTRANNSTSNITRTTVTSRSTDGTSTTTSTATTTTTTIVPTSSSKTNKITDKPVHNEDHTKLITYALVCAGIILLFLILCAMIAVIIIRRRRQNNSKSSESSTTEISSDSITKMDLDMENIRESEKRSEKSNASSNV